MPKYARLLLGSSVAALVLGGVLWASLAFTPRGSDPADQVSTPVVAAEPQVLAASTSPAEVTGWMRSWERGLQYDYALDFDQKVSLRQSTPTSPAPAAFGEALRITMKGEFTSTVVDVVDEQIYVQYRLRPDRIDLTSNGSPGLDPTSRSALLAALKKPFYVMFDRQGAAQDIFLEPGVDPVSQGLLRAMVTSLQVVLSRASEERWPSNEVDTTGAFEASYSRVAQPREFTKTRLRYLRLATPGGLLPITDGTRVTPGGQTRVKLDETLWVETLTGKERLEIVTSGDVFAILAELQIESHQLAQRSAPELVGSFLANRARLQAAGLAVATFVPESEESRLRRIVAGATLESLLVELRALPEDESIRGPATAKIMQRLTALFLLEPSKAKEVTGLIRGEGERNTYSAVIGSLSAASNPESVNALAKISGDGLFPRGVRVDAIAGLGVVERPNEKGLEELRQLSANPDEEIRSTATLALGTTARNLENNGNPLARELFNDISDKTRAAQDPRERGLQLSALANTANAEALPTIQEALRSDSVPVREAAVAALRIIPDSRADDLIASQMLKDPDSGVRRSAIFASSFRRLDPLLPALVQSMSADPEPSVRLDVVRLIGQNRNQIPNAGVLLNQASQDPSADVRQAATGFLNVLAIQPSPQPPPSAR